MEIERFQPDINPTEENEIVINEHVKVISGDITQVKADAIVCPSIPDLDVVYAGVAGAIYRAGGEAIFEEAREIALFAALEDPDSGYPVPFHSAHITSGGDLPYAKQVIHSVAVDFSDEEGLTSSPKTIFKSAWNVMEEADKHNLSSVAFPALGSGLYEVPVNESFGAIAQAVDFYLKSSPRSSIQQVILVSRDPDLPKPTLASELNDDSISRSLRKETPILFVDNSLDNQN